MDKNATFTLFNAVEGDPEISPPGISLRLEEKWKEAKKTQHAYQC
jgi:hypothetical protein